MSDLAQVITASLGVLGALGTAAAFVWNKIEKRFGAIEQDLRRCEAREDAGIERRAVQYTVIELLHGELKRLAPESWALTRGKQLLDELKRKGREEAEGDER